MPAQKQKKHLKPTTYKKLTLGSTYVFETYTFPRNSKGFREMYVHERTGTLLHVSTRVRDKKDDKGKIIGKEVVADRLSFIPTEEEELVRVWEGTGESLKLHSVNVCCGQFNISIRP